MNRNSLVIALVAIALASPFVSAALGGGADSTTAANKTTAAGSSVEYLPPDAVDSYLGVVLLTSAIKTSKPTDLLLQLTLECALWTTVTSSTIVDHPDGIDAVSRAEARVVAWVEVDGVPVKVDSGDADGKVSMCDRVHEQEVSDIDNSTGNWTLRQYLATRNANGFNWITLNVGSGVHSVVVKADIETSTDGPGALAEGAVGKRTLIVEPTRFANGATL